MRSPGYTCPFCYKLKAQNNVQNLMQHIRSKHRDRSEPCINELREAAQGRSVTEKNGEEKAKSPLILDTVEVEDKTDIAIGEKDCESL